MSRTSSPSIVEPGIVECRVVASAAELEEHFRVRREIFVAAQGLFDEDDRDEQDDRSATLHVVAVTSQGIVGAVRLYPLGEAGLWKGDRLAVLPGARAGHVGPELVRYAVRTAGVRSGQTMLAIVQRPVTRFFERLGWGTDGPVFHYRGVAHQPMRIELHPARLGDAG